MMIVFCGMSENFGISDLLLLFLLLLLFIFRQVQSVLMFAYEEQLVSVAVALIHAGAQVNQNLHVYIVVKQMCLLMSFVRTAKKL